MINLFALLCIPLALPSLFLCLTLTQKKFLGTVFNGGAAVMFAVSGNIFGLYSVCIVLVHCSYIQNIHLHLILVPFPGLCIPVTCSIFLLLLLNNPEDSSFLCGILVTLRMVILYVIYNSLHVSIFWR